MNKYFIICLVLVSLSLTCVGIVSATGSSPPVSDDMVLFMKFNNDSSVGENYGINNIINDYAKQYNASYNLSNYIYNNTGGYLNDGAFKFSPSTGNSIVTNNNISFNNSQFTINFWIYADKYSSSDRVFTIGNSTQALALCYRTASGGSLVCQLNNGSLRGAEYYNPTPDNQWSMVSLTYDYLTTNKSIYRNGAFKGTMSIPNIWSVQSSKLSIGSTSDYTSVLNGTIDDFIIYNKTLSTLDVYNL